MAITVRLLRSLYHQSATGGDPTDVLLCRRRRECAWHDFHRAAEAIAGAFRTLEAAEPLIPSSTAEVQSPICSERDIWRSGGAEGDRTLDLRIAKAIRVS
jgi:hypothetical protein